MYLFSAASGGSISKLKDGKFTRFPNPPHVGPSYLARDGSIWTSLSGFLSQIKNDHVIRYDTTTGLPNRWISAITEDSVSMIIYLDRIGIRRFFNGRLKPYLLADGKEYSSTDYVSCFYMDRRGILWIGTTVGLVQIQNGRSTTFRTTDGLADDWIRSFYEDRQGHLWLGSPRGGLTHYRDGKFISYNTKKGLFTNEIYCVLIDNTNDVWISSPEGIGCIMREDIEEYEAGKTNVVYTQIFTTADGMRTDECFGSWQPSGWKAHDGRLWFATVKGAVMIDPKTFRRNEVPPPVYIEQFIADLQTVRLDQCEPLQPGTGKLEFHYTALSYLVPERVSFKYLLEGYDRA
jgi:ligand-binding sensor domain-containing protein